MTFKWSSPEVKTLIFAYTFVGMLIFGYGGREIGKTVCYYGPDMWEMPTGTLITYAFTFAGIGALAGFVFVVSVLFTLAYVPERLWCWLKRT